MIHTSSHEEMQNAAAEFVSRLNAGDAATVVTLSGELGAGKTTFVQGIAEALGVQETVTSPTFVLAKMYPLENQKWQHLVHIDAYRLKGSHELKALGWEALLADAGNLILLEWPERIAESIPEDAVSVRIDIVREGRIISINGEEKN